MQEQNVSDLQALRVLLELLVRERAEKQVYESKQELEAEYKHVQKLAMMVKGVSETLGVDSDLSEINAIIKRLEDKANQIDEAFDKVNASPEALTLNMHHLASGRVSLPKDTTMLIEELELFFAQATGELIILSRKQIRYVLEKNKQTRDALVQGVSKSVTSFSSHKEQLPAEEVLTDLDTREKNIITSQLTIDAEVASFLQRIQEPGADIQLVFSEYEQILHLLSDFHGQMNEMLEQITHILTPLHEKRRLRRQRQRLSAMVKVILIDAMVYLL